MNDVGEIEGLSSGSKLDRFLRNNFAEFEKSVVKGSLSRNANAWRSLTSDPKTLAVVWDGYFHTSAMCAQPFVLEAVCGVLVHGFANVQKARLPETPMRGDPLRQILKRAQSSGTAFSRFSIIAPGPLLQNNTSAMRAQPFVLKAVCGLLVNGFAKIGAHPSVGYQSVHHSPQADGKKR